MSTVKTTNLQHPSASDVGITLGADGSVVLPQGFAGGLGTNVVQTVKTDTFTTASTTFVPVTGLTATITPTSTSSKVLVICQPIISGSDQVFGRLSGGGAGTFIGDAAGSRIQALMFIRSAGDRIDVSQYQQTVVFLDSPATVSPVTYGFEIRCAGTNAHVNKAHVDDDTNLIARTASSITVIEVAA